MSVRKAERWVACFDLHGDQQDADTVRVFNQFVADFRPTVRVCGGDVWDLRWLRRSASDDEKMEQVSADFEAGMEFLGKFRPTHFLWGNHDQRLRDALDQPSKGGALRALASAWLDRIEVGTKGCKHYPYDKRAGVLRYGDHSLVHGYAHGVGATRKHALVYGNVIHGHIHAIDRVSVERHDGATAYAAGCLCRLDFDYARANVGTLRQAHGWVYGVNVGGRLTVWQAQKVGGAWTLPSEFKEWR